MELTPRKEKILSSVVTGYVRTGEPVGSKAIAEQIGVSVSAVDVCIDSLVFPKE